MELFCLCAVPHGLILTPQPKHPVQKVYSHKELPAYKAAGSGLVLRLSLQTALCDALASCTSKPRMLHTATVRIMMALCRCHSAAAVHGSCTAERTSREQP